jgi:hypothetical protein
LDSLRKTYSETEVGLAYRLMVSTRKAVMPTAAPLPEEM